MLKIPRQRVLERWDTLPDNLKEALFSESNSSIVWQIGTLNHLSEEKISIMATIVGDVIFGFLHPDDLTREIQETLNLNPKIANSISREINRKIFAPLRSDLEKIYSPVTIMPEIKLPTKPEVEAKIEKEIEPKPLVEIKPEAEIKPKIEIKPEVEPKPAPLPTIPPVPAPTIPPTTIPSEKPFILQQETEPKPVGEKKRVSPPIIGWFKKEKPRPAAEAPIKVELEIFGQKAEEKKEPIVAKTEAPKQKVIHYREVEMPTPFGKAQGEPFGKPGIQPPKETQPPKTEVPMPPAIEAEKPVLPQEETEPQEEVKPQEEPAKPEEPKVISLDSFEVVKGKDKGLS
jgi:hypothetical protein